MVLYFIFAFFFQDICKEENIEGYPTYRFYSKGKFHIEYNGPRTEEEFYKFVINFPASKDEL